MFFFLSWLGFWRLHGWEKSIIQKVRPLFLCQRVGANERKSRKWYWIKAVSFPNWTHHSWGNGVSQCSSPFPILLLPCSRDTLSGNCGRNQDSDQADEALARSGVPRQHHRHEGLRGKRTDLRILHHRCFSHLPYYCSWLSSWKLFFYLRHPGGKWTEFGAQETSFLALPQTFMGRVNLMSFLPSRGLHFLG